MTKKKSAQVSVNRELTVLSDMAIVVARLSKAPYSRSIGISLGT